MTVTLEQEQKAVLARRAYQKQWRDRNKDKVREHQRRFWLKKAAEMAIQDESNH